jgi:hypothetical protein
MRDPGASFRVDADSLFAVVMSWARASNVDACFDPKEIGKSEGEEGKRLPWLPFAQLQRDLCSDEKCATYMCAEFLVKMCQNAASGATFRNVVSIHTVDLCAALTEREEKIVKSKSAERTYEWLKAPEGWENIARELTPKTLGAFLEDLDGYRILVLVSKAVIVIAREYYEKQEWKFEMWPDELIAHTGVHPLIVRYDGSKHVDGMPAYGVGQVSKGESVFLVACVTAAGDAIYGQHAGVRGGPQYAAAHLTAISNVLISVCTNGEFVEYGDEERSAFVANRKVSPQKIREAVEKMKSGDYAKDCFKKASVKNTKAAKTRNAKKDEYGKSEAAMKTNKTKTANKRAKCQLMYVIKQRPSKKGPSFAYQMTINSVPSVRLNKSGFDSELAAAVGLNDRLKVLRLPAENETWFNADKVRKQRWKEEWQVGPSGTPM